MAAGEGHAPDWRDAAAYEPLLHADRSLVAWEWLRRDPSYRAAAERAFEAGSRNSKEAGESPERWGLHAFEPPGVTAPDARPVWRAEVHPFVIGVHAVSSDGEDSFDLDRFHSICTLVTAVDGREHVLISDGLRAVRIDVETGSLKDAPVRLEYVLAGLASAERPLLTLRRLLALWRTGRFCCSLHPREARAKRWMLMLRASDAIAAGADQREIAGVLLSAEVRQPRWRTQSSSVRSRVQRLVRAARAMEASGFWTLL